MRAEEVNGLTLEGLAHRLETLERENAELRQKVATLEGADEGHHEPSASEPEGRVSRKWLLSRAGVATLGVVAAGALSQRDVRPAQAENVVNDYWKFVANVTQRGAVEGNNAHNRGFGMHGHSPWVGVRGTSNNWGVAGTCTPAPGIDPSIGVGVQGEHQGSGPGVLGSSSNGPGVQGFGQGANATGVDGRGNGYGGHFRGGKAQLQLLPKSGTGRPSGAHSKGEIYMDSNAALFVCVRSGTPGKWRKVSTTAV